MTSKRARSGEVWKFECARQIVAHEKRTEDSEIEAIASAHGLTAPWTEILKAVGIDWPSKNLPAFRTRLSRVTGSDDASATAIAMAYEMLASSYSKGLDGADLGSYRAMSDMAISFIEESSVSKEDHRAIEASTLLGLVDQGDTLMNDVVRGLVEWMVENGAFNAPNRVRVHFGTDRDLYERLIVRADNGEPHAYNLFYLGRAREELEKLRAS